MKILELLTKLSSHSSEIPAEIMSAATESLNMTYIEYLQDLISRTRGIKPKDSNKNMHFFNIDLSGETDAQKMLI